MHTKRKIIAVEVHDPKKKTNVCMKRKRIMPAKDGWILPLRFRGISKAPMKNTKMPEPLDESDIRLFDMDHVFGLEEIMNPLNKPSPSSSSNKSKALRKNITHNIKHEDFNNQQKNTSTNKHVKPIIKSTGSQLDKKKKTNESTSLCSSQVDKKRQQQRDFASILQSCKTIM